MKIFLIILIQILLSYSEGTEIISCTGHDACRDKTWNGEYEIYCGASNSERTCKNTVLNCGENNNCIIKTRGSGHDAYQFSTVNAKKSKSFKLYCQASGLRDCKSITVWCPQDAGSTCECISCPSTVTFKCVQGVSCSSVSNAHIDYVESDTYQVPASIWYKDTSHTGKRPDCPFSYATNHQNYLWGTLNWCKHKCMYETTGKCNMVSRYGDSSKTADQAYHCRFYECPNPNNVTWITQTQWGNYANECNTYIIPIRHFTIESRMVNVTQYIFQNITNFIDVINYINKTLYENITNYIDINRYHDHYVNKTKYINETNFIDIIRFVNKTLYNNITNFKNITNFIDVIRYINKTLYKNITNYIDINRYNDYYINKTTTNYIDVIRYINKTFHENITNFINVIKYLNKTSNENITFNQIINNDDNLDYDVIKNDKNESKIIYDNNQINIFVIACIIELIIIIILTFIICFQKRFKDQRSEETTFSSSVPPLAEVAPIAIPVNKDRHIDIEMIERGNFVIEEGVKTPGGTTIRRRSVQI